MAKRAFDIIVASLGLIALAPVFILVAWWIKLDSVGPVFFRQERVGRHGVPFRIHKFRSMQVQPEQGASLTVGDDVRITCAGRFLRAWKLDELPQLIDVLQGTMSLVGPRPEVAKYVAMYPPAVRDVLLSVRPGITDPASIEMRNEAMVLARAADPEREYVDVIMPAKIEAAARYVKQATLARDIRLILSTMWHVLARR